MGFPNAQLPFLRRGGQCRLSQEARSHRGVSEGIVDAVIGLCRLIPYPSRIESSLAIIFKLIYDDHRARQ
jgi:hypothetical protein